MSTKLPKKASENLPPSKRDLRLLILTRRVLFWDRPTVITILAKQAYLRFYGDERISYYTAHEHKDLAGILEDRILDHLTDETYVMHDHNTVNYNEAFHFRNLECCQHVERDLQKSADDTKHEEMVLAKKLISEAIKERNDLFARGSCHSAQNGSQSLIPGWRSSSAPQKQGSARISTLITARRN